MEKSNFPKSFKVYLPLILLFLLLVFLMPRSSRFSYDYKKGSTWQYETLIAQFDFPILKSDVQIQQEKDKAWEDIIPYYRHNKTIAREVDKNLAEIDLGRYS